MSDDPTPLSQIPPLGKSVEEVEEDNQNLVNPPAPGDRAGADDVEAVLPWGEATAGARGPTGGTPSPGIPVVPVITLDDTENTEDGAHRGDRPRDETTDNAEA